jgi:hypothetical protein
MGDYSDLQTSVLDTLKEPSSLTAADARKFIGLAEFALERHMLSNQYGASVPFQMLAVSTGQTDSENKYPLPSDYINARAVKINDQRARYASVELVAPSQDGYSEADVTLNYYQRIPILSDLNTSNWLLDVGYDAYMWGAALQYNVWGQEDEGGKIWADYYGDAMRTIKKAYKQQPRGGLYRHSNRYYSSFYTVYGDSLLFGRAVA